MQIEFQAFFILNRIPFIFSAFENFFREHGWMNRESVLSIHNLSSGMIDYMVEMSGWWIIDIPHLWYPVIGIDQQDQLSLG